MGHHHHHVNFSASTTTPLLNHHHQSHGHGLMKTVHQLQQKTVHQLQQLKTQPQVTLTITPPLAQTTIAIEPIEPINHAIESERKATINACVWTIFLFVILGISATIIAVIIRVSN